MDLNRLDEYELWKHCQDVLNACTVKANTGGRVGAAAVQGLRAGRACSAAGLHTSAAAAVVGVRLLRPNLRPLLLP